MDELITIMVYLAVLLPFIAVIVAVSFVILECLMAVFDRMKWRLRDYLDRKFFKE